MSNVNQSDLIEHVFGFFQNFKFNADNPFVYIIAFLICLVVFRIGYNILKPQFPSFKMVGFSAFLLIGLFAFNHFVLTLKNTNSLVLNSMNLKTELTNSHKTLVLQEKGLAFINFLASNGIISEITLNDGDLVFVDNAKRKEVAGYAFGKEKDIISKSQTNNIVKAVLKQNGERLNFFYKYIETSQNETPSLFVENKNPSEIPLEFAPIEQTQSKELKKEAQRKQVAFLHKVTVKSSVDEKKELTLYAFLPVIFHENLEEENNSVVIGEGEFFVVPTNYSLIESDTDFGLFKKSEINRIAIKQIDLNPEHYRKH